jgi:hypothetical protein
VNNEEALALRKLIETRNEKGLKLTLTYYNETPAVIDKTMSSLPKEFSVAFSKGGQCSWKEATAKNLFGIHEIEVVMFYPNKPKKPKRKGGDIK